MDVSAPLNRVGCSHFGQGRTGMGHLSAPRFYYFRSFLDRSVIACGSTRIDIDQIILCNQIEEFLNVGVFAVVLRQNRYW
jgi:hypothetical protein